MLIVSLVRFDNPFYHYIRCFGSLIYLPDLETRVVQWIARVTREALLSHDDTIDIASDLGDPELAEPEATTLKLGYATVKAWAQMFKLCNSPWPIVQLVGQSLDRYAGMIHAPPLT